jgi:hypothetical protein
MIAAGLHFFAVSAAFGSCTLDDTTAIGFSLFITGGFF